MNRIAISIIAAAVASMAMPAAAQQYSATPRASVVLVQHQGRGPAYAPPRRGEASMAARVQVLRRNVDFAHRAGAMSTGKAREFQRDIENLVHLESRYRAEGRLREQRSALERRYQTLDRAISRYVRDAERRRGGNRR
jgi:hypothetical protein